MKKKTLKLLSKKAETIDRSELKQFKGGTIITEEIIIQFIGTEDLIMG